MSELAGDDITPEVLLYDEDEDADETVVLLEGEPIVAVGYTVLQLGINCQNPSKAG